jgi:hypothetical protein
MRQITEITFALLCVAINLFANGVVFFDGSFLERVVAMQTHHIDIWNQTAENGQLQILITIFLGNRLLTRSIRSRGGSKYCPEYVGQGKESNPRAEEIHPPFSSLAVALLVKLEQST